MLFKLEFHHSVWITCIFLFGVIKNFEAHIAFQWVILHYSPLPCKVYSYIQKNWRPFISSGSGAAIAHRSLPLENSNFSCSSVNRIILFNHICGLDCSLLIWIINVNVLMKRNLVLRYFLMEKAIILNWKLDLWQCPKCGSSC